MSPRLWFCFAIVVVMSLWLAKDVGATQTSSEEGKGSGTVCEGNITYFWNLTVTNDDSISSEYDIVASAIDVDIEPASAHLELDFGESEVVQFKGYPGQRTSPGNLHVTILIDSSNGDDASEEWVIAVDHCAILFLKAHVLQAKGKLDENITLLFNLTDMGNFEDEINLTLEGVPIGWQAHYQHNLTMRGNETLNLTLSLIPGTTGSVVLRLTATTSAPGINITVAEITVIIEKEESFTGKYWKLIALSALSITAATGVAVYLKRE